MTRHNSIYICNFVIYNFISLKFYLMTETPPEKWQRGRLRSALPEIAFLRGRKSSRNGCPQSCAGDFNPFIAHASSYYSQVTDHFSFSSLQLQHKKTLRLIDLILFCIAQLRSSYSKSEVLNILMSYVLMSIPDKAIITNINSLLHEVSP